MYYYTNLLVDFINLHYLLFCAISLHYVVQKQLKNYAIQTFTINKIYISIKIHCIVSGLYRILLEMERF